MGSLGSLFQVTRVAEIPARYNIAPTQPILAVRQAEPGAGRELVALRWGLIPSWAQEPASLPLLINARSETAAVKPAFRAALRRRRCLVPADGFYEWQRAEGRKQPFHMRRRDGAPFAFAGVWERWEGAEGAVDSCALLTTASNELMRPIHDRMPVILDPAEFDLWLDPEMQDIDVLQGLLRPYPADAMIAYPVSPIVNSARNDSPQCVLPLETG